MKTITYFIVLTLLLTSCEDVIDMDLKNVETNIIIEGLVNQDSGLAKVTISETMNFFNTEAPVFINTAEVFIIADDDKEVQLPLVASGIYAAKLNYVSSSGSYKLKVKYQEKNYEAVSVIIDNVNIDSIKQEFLTTPMGHKDGYIVKCYFNDPQQEANYYRIKLYKDGSYLNNLKYLFVTDDQLFNGNQVELWVNRGNPFEGDALITVELISIDKNVYEYFKSLEQLNAQGPRAMISGGNTPSNPNSNISNKALGYFSVYTSNCMEIQLPK